MHVHVYVVGESVSADGLRARENEEREKKVREKERGKEERRESSERFVVSLFLSLFPFFSFSPSPRFSKEQTRASTLMHRRVVIYAFPKTF